MDPASSPNHFGSSQERHPTDPANGLGICFTDRRTARVARLSQLSFRMWWQWACQDAGHLAPNQDQRETTALLEVAGFAAVVFEAFAPTILIGGMARSTSR